MESLVSSLLTSEIYQHFSLISVTEKPHGIEMRLEEYSEFVSKDISGKVSVVLDGFCNPIELSHFSFKGKSLYLKIYRRRWKESGSSTHYSNHYGILYVCRDAPFGRLCGRRRLPALHPCGGQYIRIHYKKHAAIPDLPMFRTSEPVRTIS
ncbi:MAG: hypothetical protein LBD27_04060 [Tannerella sp.]|jgi:hypothetical protein|nr:hypothetical protein [Tannerella sp.]